MRILYVTQGFPYPLTSGLLRQYHFIRTLSESHTIRLVSMTGADFLPEHAEAMAPFTERVSTFPSTDRSGSVRRKVAGRLRAWVDPTRGSAAASSLRRGVESAILEEPFDAVVASGKRTYPAVYAATRAGVPVVADICDATSVNLRGRLRHASLARRLPLALELMHIRHVESRLVEEAAHLVFASVRDRDALVPAGGMARANVVPNGVDVSYWQRSTPSLTSGHIVFTGAMSYPPNEDAALLLAEAILPRVRRVLPEAHLWIVGRDPKPRLVAAGQRPGVTVTGTVEDVRPYLDRAAVFAAPLRFGAGIQNKLLEAMAMEVPSVASPLAAAGLRTLDGQEPAILVAEADPDSFAEAIVARLGESARTPLPDHAGRAFVLRHFSWQASGAVLSAVLERVAATAGRTARASRRAPVDSPGPVSLRSSVASGPSGDGLRTSARPRAQLGNSSPDPASTGLETRPRQVPAEG